MRLIATALLPLVMLLTACESGTDVDANAHVGTYTLRTVNGSNLPAPLGVEDGMTLSVTTGSITVNANGTLTGSVTIRGVQGSTTVEEAEVLDGTWTRSGDDFSVTPADGGEPFTMEFDADDREMTATGGDGTLLVFRR